MLLSLPFVLLLVPPDSATFARTVETASVPVVHNVVKANIVTGTVIDAKTHQPIAGARVALDDSVTGTFTDDAGRFRFPAVLTGMHNVVVRSIGYVWQVKLVNVSPMSGASVEFLLEATPNAFADTPAQLDARAHIGGVAAPSPSFFVFPAAGRSAAP